MKIAINVCHVNATASGEESQQMTGCNGKFASSRTTTAAKPGMDAVGQWACELLGLELRGFRGVLADLSSEMPLRFLPNFLPGRSSQGCSTHA